MSAELHQLYEEMIMDHNRHPHNFMKQHKHANSHAEGFNPICNDKFELHLTIDDGRIKDAAFEGMGCAISTASTSMMTEAVIGLTTHEAETLFANIHNLLTHEGEYKNIGKMVALDGVRDYPNRIKCATLAWHMLHAALTGEQGIISTEQYGSARE